MIHALLVTSLLAGAPHSPSLKADAPPRAMELDVGAQKVLDFPGVARIALGDPGVADVKPLDGHQVLVVGKSQGHTTLLLWSSRGGTPTKVELSVSRHTGEALEEALHKMLPGADLRVDEFNGRRVVRGKVLTVADLRRLQQLTEGDAEVVLMVDLDRSAQTYMVVQINNALQREGMKNAHAVLVGSKIFLEGSVQDEGEAKKASLIAESVYGATVERMP